MLQKSRFVRQLLKKARALVLCLAAFGSASSYAVDVSGVRFGQNGDTTRFVVDLSGDTQPKIFLLADPYRIVIDLPEVSWKGGGAVNTMGIVDGYRHGLFTDGMYRIVLDLKNPAVVANAFTLPASNGRERRYVVDIKPSNRSQFLAAVQSSKAQRSQYRTTVQSAPAVSNTRRKDGKHVIVLDPGHGGVDPGNLGVIGVHEKVITLKIARAIRDELKRTGRYEVHMTRNRDIFHKVRERFQIARRLNADLFISIHADSIRNSKVRGGSVYNLSEKASDREAERLAARENKSDLIAGVNLDVVEDDVSGILIELAQRETMNYSAQFAEILVGEMKGRVPTLQRAHRFANLGVLKAPDVPSVLLEAGYLTNRSNAQFLNSSRGQKLIAESTRRAIDKYFSTIVIQSR
ncbi:MAG: N-acetylmuramoyl-L-alanine amidase [Kordiimonadaceae bacterium]|nr:N-acetylmuramoyl-L-alanine amidase [Kordiimonadaceae bacterium]MBO6570139.1 N-acetylmuramoyl-L-alanine amidase [Kordiimonadaceae bacterium]MBO6965763.1 N-acetylmuramoyl-L-alanine amidase [Kordiimonadaceae bacterium]